MLNCNDLNRILKENGISKTELQKETGLSSRTIAKIAKGDKLAASSIAKIESYLQTKVDAAVLYSQADPLLQVLHEEKAHGDDIMPKESDKTLERYIDLLKTLYDEHLKDVILYGSRARGDHRPDSDIDICILLDLEDDVIKAYRKRLSSLTYDFNLENNVEIMPIAKNKRHYLSWVNAYPFYNTIQREGIHLYGVA